MIEEGLLQGLKKAGFQDGGKLDLYHFYMDTQNTHISKDAIAARAELALEEIKRLQPWGVVLLDDNAFELVLPPLVDGPMPVFFGGTNVPLEYYNDTSHFMESRNHPGKNVTGVTEEHEFPQNLRLIKSLYPQARTGVIIYSASTPFINRMGQANEAYIADHGKELPIRFLPARRIETFEEYKALIKQFNQDPAIDIIYTFAPVSLIREDGNVNPVIDTIGWMAAHQSKPGFTWMTNWVEAGYLASAGIDLIATGETLASKVVKTLAGASPGDLPIENPDKYSIALNLDRAKTLGLDIPIDILEAAEKIYSQPEVSKD